MNDVQSVFEALVVGRKHSRKSWNGDPMYLIDCPACSDKRRRGALILSTDGSVTYTCKNGGCEFEQKATRWESDARFGRRIRAFFESIGGNIQDLPYKLFTRRPSTIPRDPEVVYPTWDFPEIDLPAGSRFLVDGKSRDAEDVRAYVRSRSLDLDQHPFVWSWKYPRSVIIPCIHDGGKIVGWIRREIDPGEGSRYWKCQGFPSDYLLNQHMVANMVTVPVMENPFDAIALRGLCSFGAKLTPRMLALLAHVSKTPIYIDNEAVLRKVVLIPDQQHGPTAGEWSSYLAAARAHGFEVSVPRFPGAGKDAGDSIAEHGVLATIESIVASRSVNHQINEVRLLVHGARRSS